MEATKAERELLEFRAYDRELGSDQATREAWKLKNTSRCKGHALEKVKQRVNKRVICRSAILDPNH